MDYMVNKANVADPQVPIITTENGGKDVRKAIQGEGLSTGSFIVEPDRTIFDIPASEDNFLNQFETLLSSYSVGKHSCNETDLKLVKNSNIEIPFSLIGGKISWDNSIQVTSIELINLNGKCIFKENLIGDNSSFNLGNKVSNGIYLLKIKGNGITFVKNLLIKKL